jgi:hypothetical protein
MTELKMKMKPWEPRPGTWMEYQDIPADVPFVGRTLIGAVILVKSTRLAFVRLPDELRPTENDLRRIITPRDKVIFNGDGTARIEWAETEAEIRAEDLPHNVVFETQNGSGGKFLWRVHNYDIGNREYCLLSYNGDATGRHHIAVRNGMDSRAITRVLGILEGFEEA